MPLGDRGYSRLVGWLKIALPLGAIALLSTLFLFARPVDPTRGLPFAEVDVEELAREQRISAPFFAGVTEDGAAVSISAATARPGEDGLTVEEMRGQIDAADGTTVLISAAGGEIDRASSRAAFRGDVRIATSGGYTVTADAVESALDATLVEAAGPVRAKTPFGQIDAGRMVLAFDAEEQLSRIDFTGGVDLLYEPQRRPRDPATP